MTDRHYNDDEVAAILGAAAEDSQSRTLPDGLAEGLTLRDLQAVAREAGISADAVARAAQSLDRQSAPPAAAQTFLGFPIGVERTVPLQRSLTDEEWELLVVELRQTFRARGTVRVQGSMREWSNGRLHAFLEPTRTGAQLRLTTLKEEAYVSVAGGVVAGGMSALVGAMAEMKGTLSLVVPLVATLATVGAALIANGTLRLPAWARRRQRQFDSIADRVALATQSGRSAPALPADSSG
jgi:hypothetical protein